MTGQTFPEWSDADYFAHPALSHSDTKLLDPPALYRWHKDNPYQQVQKPEFDFGHAVHRLSLGAGPDLHIIPADSWRTKAAKEERDKAYEVGHVPLLEADANRAHACADAILAHPVVAKLFDHLDHVELGTVWTDPEHQLERKAKLDAVSGRFGIDVKTTGTSAATDSFGRSAAKFGYATQQAWYRDAMIACLNIEEPAFLFVVVETRPPYLVNVIKLDEYDVTLAARRNSNRIELFKRCLEADDWPGYGDGINVAELPRWAEIEMETE